MEKVVFEIIERFGFDITAKSPIGVSISGTKDLIEKTFRTEIELDYAEVKGGTAGPITVPVLSFSRPPTIPEALKPYIVSAKFSPPVIPLN